MIFCKRPAPTDDHLKEAVPPDDHLQPHDKCIFEIPHNDVKCVLSMKESNFNEKQDKVNNADSAFIFLIIQSQNQWSGGR